MKEKPPLRDALTTPRRDPMLSPWLSVVPLPIWAGGDDVPEGDEG